MKKMSSKKLKNKQKYIIPGLLAILIVTAILLGNKYIQKNASTSIYNIEEAGTNFNDIKLGDTINYEVNGYSDWQVIRKDSI